MTGEIVVQHDNFIAPVADITTALRRYQAVKDFIGAVLKEGVDYGKVPGSDKFALLKAGAEKMTAFFGFSVRTALLDFVEDWTGKDHDGEPFFNYRYQVQLWRGDQLIAEGEGSCNSWEKKYRYRQAERVCPKCGKPTIIKGKEEYGGGWICFLKKGGCGAKFADNAPDIISQQLGQVKNADPADIVNTLQKMAQKRALVAPVLIATNTSDYFTQDIEDFIDGTVTEVAPPVVPPAPPAEHSEPPAPTGKMKLETALAVTNSKGVKLADLPTDKLAFMANSLIKSLKDNNLDDEQHTDKQYELDAVQIVIASRNKAG